MNALVVGGASLPDPDGEWGYGAPRILQPVDVAVFNRALEVISDEDLATRFDPADMTAKEIYPLIWDRDPREDDALGYLMEHVSVLRDFIRTASANGDGVLVVIV